MDEAEIAALIKLPATCDQGRALHKLLNLLVTADFNSESRPIHFIQPEETDEEYEQRVEAEKTLGQLATAWAAK